MFYKFEIDNSIINKISENSIILYDLDGTLVDTNKANNSAYLSAIKHFIEVDNELFSNDVRITREILKEKLINVEERLLKKIIKKKEELYNSHLDETKIISPVETILKNTFNKNTNILVSSSKRSRAINILKYHNLFEKFNQIYCNGDSNEYNRNKYLGAVLKYKIPIENIIVLENELKEVDNALKANIKLNNIIIIRNHE